MDRKLPLRKCVACQERKPKRDLLRVVADASGAVRIDPTGKASGRGAYLCRNAACITKARKKNLLKYALKTTVDDTVYEEIMDYVES